MPETTLTADAPRITGKRLPAEPGTYEHLLPGARVAVDPHQAWTERDHADQYIVDTMVPLLELADAFPRMIELIGDHLLARFGNPEPSELATSDALVVGCWDNLVGFVVGMQEMLTADRPEAMAGTVRLARMLPSPPAERVVVHAASNGHAAAEVPGWEER